MSLSGLLINLGSVDPAPLFALSLFPFLAFLWWARRSGRLPALALVGFALTLLFVAITIGAAIVAEQQFGRQLADVDPLHGGAEAFLTLSNLLVLLGFYGDARRAGDQGLETAKPLDPLPGEAMNKS